MLSGSRSAPSPLRTDPYRLLFPLGVVLAWAGVLHWLLYAVGATDRYAAVFHSVAQIQGFMTCFAVGFLLTFLPRRSGTAPPAAWELAAAAAAPPLAVAAAWAERQALAQALWLGGVLVMVAFAGRRLLAAGAGRRFPPVFVWVPLSLLAGAAGAAATAVAAAVGPQQAPELWSLGRGWVMQGLLTGLAVGVGGTLLPTLTRAEPVPEVEPGRGRRARLLQAAAALAFLASFPLEVFLSARLGLAIRAAASGSALVASARAWRLPSVPGLHRWFVWLAAWLLPAGYVLAAALPDQRAAALHVVFVGGFALLGLSVSLHVSLSHGGRPELLGGRPWPLWAMGGLVLAALAFRLLAGLDPGHLRPWLGAASGAFLAATLAWAALAAPALRRAPRPEGGPAAALTRAAAGAPPAGPRGPR